jgi:hypothetical protein
LRSAFTDAEWRVLQARLTGARKAIDLIQARAPSVARRVWQRTLEASPPRGTSGLEPDTKELVEGLIASLLRVEGGEGLDQLPAAPPALRLVVRN